MLRVVEELLVVRMAEELVLRVAVVVLVVFCGCREAVADVFPEPVLLLVERVLTVERVAVALVLLSAVERVVAVLRVVVAVVRLALSERCAVCERPAVCTLSERLTACERAAAVFVLPKVRLLTD